jgi:hypothetical protein
MGVNATNSFLRSWDFKERVTPCSLELISHVIVFFSHNKSALAG